MDLPFAHLNLRYNPFGELTGDQRARIAVVDVDRYVRLLAQPKGALLFLGNPGRGKTSHLLAIRTRFPHAPYLHLPEGGPVPLVPEAPTVFVDELQRMPRRQRHRLFRRPDVSWVIGSHRDHRREMKAAGLEVERVFVASRAPQHLAQIVQRRIESARRNLGPVPTLDASAIGHLIQRFGDDQRGIEHYLYDVFQHLEEPGHVQV